MRPTPSRLPRVLMAFGLAGLAVLIAGRRLGWDFLPTDDFDVGLWVGSCLGLQIVAVLLMLKAKYEPAA